jgi:hypothetical protein
MKAVLDNEIIFNEESFELEIKSFQREVVQRSAAGLDGQVSIDLGLRGRKLVQKGQLRAKNQAELQKIIDAINGLIDGNEHILKSTDGRVFENLVIESFQAGSFVFGGAQTSCQYQLTYLQQG